MRPLLTLALVTYNQEKFIAQAVQCAFAQTYSPLEIILSDDASTDGTFEILRKMTEQYRGPHRVVLNRNEQNCGLARQVNQIARLAKGELVLAAAGDDLSIPERTEILFKAWNDTGREATCLHSRVTHIDVAGQPTEAPAWEHLGEPTYRIISQKITPLEYIKTQQPDVLGCTCAWAPSLFKTFGDLPEDVIHEDNAIVFRALLQSGSILFVDTPLVKYRVHGGNLFNSRNENQDTIQEIENQGKRMARNFTRRAIMHRVFGHDIRTAFLEGLIAEPEFYPAYHLTLRMQRLFKQQREFMTARLPRKLSLLIQLYFTDINRSRLGKLALRLLPPRAIHVLKKARNGVRSPLQKCPPENRAQPVDAVCE
jgi:glycosyltransferase involved in cell wall biosynthesis